MLKKFNIFKKLNSNDNVKKSLHNSYFVKIIIIIITISICSLFYILRVYSDYSTLTSDIPNKGFVWTGENIVADYSFPIKRPQEEYRKDLEEVELNSYMIFDFQENILNQEIKRFNIISKGFRSNNSNIKDDEYNRINAIVLDFLNSIYSKTFINFDLSELKNIAIYSNSKKIRKLVPYEYIYDYERVKQVFNTLNIEQINREYFNYLNNEFVNKLKPNNIFNKPLTDNEIDILKASIPKTNGFVSKGEILIKKGDKITEEHLLKLQSYRASLFEIETHDNKFFVYLGSVGHFILVFSFLLIYIFKLKQDEFYDNVKFGMLCSFLIIISILSYLSITLSNDYPLEYFITIPAFSMLAVILFDFRTAFYLTVTMSLMAAGIRGNDYIIGITMMFAGILSIYSIRNIKERSQLYKSILFIFLGYFLALIFLGLERNISLDELIQNTAFAAINSAVSPLISFGLLFILERVFKFTSILGIEEFDNLNNKLLLQLNDLATGTYNHSLNVSNLSSKCATAIGADAEFCKVASYYHDIGKIEKPEYFAENLDDKMINKHNNISPYTSAKIIIAHVTSGVEIAKKYKLPERIIDIIKEHHGTTVLNHFYQKAVTNDGFEKVNKDDFIYPGPIPQSKESAIIMLCDQVEAISRLPEDKRGEPERFVEDVIENMLNQNQLDDSGITIKDLKVIKNILIKQVPATIHKRVEYKKQFNDNES